MNLDIYTWEEPDDHGSMFGASTTEEPFAKITGFGDTELEALKQFCIAMVGAIQIEIEDSK